MEFVGGASMEFMGVGGLHPLPPRRIRPWRAQLEGWSNSIFIQFAFVWTGGYVATRMWTNVQTFSSIKCI
jgi:hypothetical protein